MEKKLIFAKVLAILALLIIIFILTSLHFSKPLMNFFLTKQGFITYMGLICLIGILFGTAIHIDPRNEEKEPKKVNS